MGFDIYKAKIREALEAAHALLTRCGTEPFITEVAPVAQQIREVLAALDDDGQCKWEEDISDEYWGSACGHLFQFSEGGPTVNKFEHCPYCGRKLIELLPPPEKDDG